MSRLEALLERLEDHYYKINNKEKKQRNFGKLTEPKEPKQKETIIPIDELPVINFSDKSLERFITSGRSKVPFIESKETMSFDSVINTQTGEINVDEKYQSKIKDFFDDTDPSITQSLLKDPKYQSIAYIISTFSGINRLNINWLTQANKDNPNEYQYYLSICIAFEETLQQLFQQPESIEALKISIIGPLKNPKNNPLFTFSNRIIALKFFENLKKHLPLDGSYVQFFSQKGVVESIFALRRLVLLRLLSDQIKDKIQINRKTQKIKTIIDPYTNFDYQILSPFAKSLELMSKGQIPLNTHLLQENDIVSLSMFFSFDDYVRNYHKDDPFTVHKPYIPIKIKIKNKSPHMLRSEPDIFLPNEGKIPIFGDPRILAPFYFLINEKTLFNQESGICYEIPDIYSIFGFNGKDICHFSTKIVKRFNKPKKIAN